MILSRLTEMKGQVSLERMEDNALHISCTFSIALYQFKHLSTPLCYLRPVPEAFRSKNDTFDVHYL